MRAVVLLASGVLLATPLWANAEGTEAGTASDAVSAMWTPQELQFKVDENANQYTCQQFRDTVKALLLALGARKDLHVDQTPCTNTNVAFAKSLQE